MNYLNGIHWDIQRAPIIQPDPDTPPEGGEIESVSLVEIHDLWDFAVWVGDDAEREKTVKAFLMASPGFEAWARSAMDTEIENADAEDLE